MLNKAPAWLALGYIEKFQNLESPLRKLRARFRHFRWAQSFFNTWVNRLSIAKTDRADALSQCIGTFFYIKIMPCLQSSLVRVSGLLADFLWPLCRSTSFFATWDLDRLRYETLLASATWNLCHPSWSPLLQNFDRLCYVGSIVRSRSPLLYVGLVVAYATWVLEASVWSPWLYKTLVASNTWDLDRLRYMSVRFRYKGS